MELDIIKTKVAKLAKTKNINIQAAWALSFCNFVSTNVLKTMKMGILSARMQSPFMLKPFVS